MKNISETIKASRKFQDLSFESQIVEVSDNGNIHFEYREIHFGEVKFTKIFTNIVEAKRFLREPKV